MIYGPGLNEGLLEALRSLAEVTISSRRESCGDVLFSIHAVELRHNRVQIPFPKSLSVKGGAGGFAGYKGLGIPAPPKTLKDNL